jgi:hypothetical protein
LAAAPEHRRTPENTLLAYWRDLRGLRGGGRRRDTRLYDDVDWAARHHEMLDAVAPDQHQFSAAVDVSLIDNLEAALAFRPEQQGRRTCSI